MARKLSERLKSSSGDVKIARSKQQGVKLPKKNEVANSAESQPILQRLHANQRTETLASMGNTHGNRHMQRVVASMRQTDEQQTDAQPMAAPPSSSMSTQSSTVSTPFSVSIGRSAEPSQRAAIPQVAAMSREDTSDDGKDKDTKHEDLFEKMIEEAEKLQEKKSSAIESADPAKEQADAATLEDSQVAPEGQNQLNAAQLEEAQSSVEEPFRLPDVELEMLEEYEKNDAVEGNLNYQSSVKKDGPDPTGFGTTRSFNVKLTNIIVKPTATSYEISGTLERPITYQVRSGAGPQGQVDIKTETASEITAANYEQVSEDLMPNPGDLGGRSPRRQFWAEDLTLRHEEMHAKDDKDNGSKVMATVSEWLEENSASNAGDIWQLLNMIPAQFAVAALEEQSIEEAEKKAYGDGLSSYQQRARAIKIRGDAGKYQ